MTVTDIVGGADLAGAWEKLDQEYGPMVVAWCRQAGLQIADAEDVKQEVLLHLSQKLPKYHLDRPGDNFRGLLHRFTTNEILHHRRASAVAEKARSALVQEVANQATAAGCRHTFKAAREPVRPLAEAEAGTTDLELADEVVAALFVATQSCRQELTVVKCVALIIWRIDKWQVDVIVHEVTDRLNLDPVSAECLLNLIRTPRMPKELCYFRRRPSWPTFMNTFQEFLKKSLGPKN